MPDEERRERGKRRICLMGAARALLPEGATGSEQLSVTRDAEAMELLALLVLGREFLPPQGVKEEDRADGEVRRDWLAATMYPADFAQEDGRRAARERVRYLLDKLHPRPDRAPTGEAAKRPPPLPIRVHLGERERAVTRLTWKSVSVDVLALREAARQMHLADKQQEIIAFGDRPLLEGMAYPWLQGSAFQSVCAELDTYFLTALARQADSQIVQMEKANGAGRFAEADAYRGKALPLLDKAAERLRGYGGLRRRPEWAALLPLEAQFSELRARAAYPLPDSREAYVVPFPPTHNLPSPVTSFVGRERERQDIRDLLTSGRLVTLTGMGGCGKTRLAVQAAWELLGDWEGVRLVELAALTDSDRVPQAIATALGVTEQKGVTVTEALIGFLQAKRTLLLLDNCEHLLPDDRSETDDCGTFAALLLRACPALSILATSRKPLNIDGEQLCPVSPLPCPTPNFLPADAPDPVAALLGYDAAQLFVDRALQFRRFTPGPENVGPVAAICAALDGIPLALELAAARVKALPLERIAEMLSDRFGLLTNGRRESPARHKTLRAVIDWSYDLLTEPERLLLCRLSVFAGGWILDAAEAVGSSEGLPCADVLNLLESLVDKSLVIADLTASPGRYRMLETVGQYAADRLRERGEWEETRRRHRDNFLALAEEAEPHLKGQEPTRWLDRMETEISNLRAALEWHTDEMAVRLACALTRFWLVRGYQQEGSQWLVRGARTEDDVATGLRAKALNCAGSLEFSLGNFQSSQRLHEESLALSEPTGDKALVAESLNSLGGVAAHLGDYGKAKTLIGKSLGLRRGLRDDEGVAGSLSFGAMVANYQGDYGTAKGMLQESLTLLRQIKDLRSIANCLLNLGIVAYYESDLAAAYAFFEESLALWRPLGDKYSIAKSLNGLGEIALLRNNSEAAQKIYAESLDLRRQAGDKYGMANSLNGLGEAALSQCDYPAARDFFEESLALRHQIGDIQSVPHSLHNLGELTLRQGDPVAARAFFTDSLRLMQENADLYGIAHALEALAAASTSPEQGERAACLLGAADALRIAIHCPRAPNVQEGYATRVAALRTLIGDAIYEAAWTEGQIMSWEQAVAFALGEDTP